ncbi:MAG: hypothetical protein GX981_00025 [Tissierellia bacterium]|nr:hypothetical protein [Tissierellia bacterium]
MNIILDGKYMTSKEKTHEYLKKELDLPEYYGNNLDALWDVLMDIDCDLNINLINLNIIVNNLGDYGNSLIEVFEDASKSNDNIKLNICI